MLTRKIKNECGHKIVLRGGEKVIKIKRKIKDLSSRQSRKEINGEPQGTFEEKGAFTPREGKITEMDNSEP